MCCKVGAGGVELALALKTGVAGLLPLSHPGRQPPPLPRLPWTGISEKSLAFRGHFDYSLDAKNRLTVPTKFRAAFSSGIVLAKGLEPCIAIWTPDAFDTWTDS